MVGRVCLCTCPLLKLSSGEPPSCPKHPKHKRHLFQPANWVHPTDVHPCISRPTNCQGCARHTTTASTTQPEKKPSTRLTEQYSTGRGSSRLHPLHDLRPTSNARPHILPSLPLLLLRCCCPALLLLIRRCCFLPTLLPCLLTAGLLLPPLGQCILALRPLLVLASAPICPPSTSTLGRTDLPLGLDLRLGHFEHVRGSFQQLQCRRGSQPS